MTSAGAGCRSGCSTANEAASALRKAGVEVRLGETVNAIDLTGPLASPRRPQEDGTGPGHQFEVQTAKGKMGADGVVVALPHYCTERYCRRELCPNKCGRPSWQLPDRQRPRPLRPPRHRPALPGRARDGSPVGLRPHGIFGRHHRAVPGGFDIGGRQLHRRSPGRPRPRGGRLSAGFASGRSTGAGAAHPRDPGAPCYVPGHPRQRRAPGRHQDPGPGLVLAGAWTATGWPPTMEGAVRSGVSAARAVLVSVGQRDGLPPLPREVNGTAHGGPEGNGSLAEKQGRTGTWRPKLALKRQTPRLAKRRQPVFCPN